MWAFAALAAAFARRWSHARNAGVCFALCVFTIVGSLVVESIQVRRAKVIGDAIAMQLESYLSEHGYLPTALHEMVPGISGRVPSTGIGLLTRRDYIYIPFSNAIDYRLEFRVSGFTRWARSMSSEWHVED